MDEVVPFRVLSPRIVNQKTFTRPKQKFSKLSLKRKYGKTNNSKQENPRDKSADNENSDILTSDESALDESFATVGGFGTEESSLISSGFPESTFSLPAAESTRYEPSQPAFNNLGDVERHTPHQHASVESSSYSDFVTACPVTGYCDDSVIYISDSGNKSPKELTKKASNAMVRRSTIIISSDESDVEPRIPQQKDVLAKKVSNTVLVESSGSDDGVEHRWCRVSRKPVIISPSFKSSSRSSSSHSIISNSLSSDENGPLLTQMKKSLVIGTARSSSSSIVSSSVKPNAEIHCSDFVVNQNNVENNPNGNNFDDSSWKEDFHLQLQDTPVNLSPQKKSASEGLVTQADQSRVHSTLTKDKYQDIKRWILKSRSSEGSDSGNEVTDNCASCSGQNSSRESISSASRRSSSRPPSKPLGQIVDLGNQCDSPSLDYHAIKKRLYNIHTSKEGNTPKSSTNCRTPNLDESEDRFEAFMNSIKQTRTATHTKQRSSSSSFINDDSSVEESCSPTIYLKDMSKSVRTEGKLIARKFPVLKENCQRKISFTPELDSSDESEMNHLKSSSESDKDDSDWEPNMRAKPIKGRSKLIPDGKDSSLDSGVKKIKKPECPTKGKKGTKKDESSDCDRNKRITSTATSRVPATMPFKKPTSTPSHTPLTKQKVQTPIIPYSPIRTFLSSLSGPPIHQSIRSHPEAEIYYKDFKKKKEELTRRLFKLYNREVFDSRLPQDMAVEWNPRMVRTAGFCYCRLTRKSGTTMRSARIALSTKVVDSADRLRDTLIHEMCHAAVWLLNHISGGHGPFWKAWADKARKRFPELPEINRCHDYKIETKYTYRCTECGYSFGRHSKSLDLEKKRCGYCYGKFEVLLSKHASQERKENVPLKTPKTPSAFALFVKENYGSVKKENAHFKHGDVMKKLGEKFSSIKLKQRTES